MSQTDYELVVGLEVHAQLSTQTKLFCSDSTVFGLAPNTQVSPVSLGHPGTLPRMNAEAINMAVKLGLALNCQIVQHNYFARKNYFYPDLPKGYQISQHTTPICRNGFAEVVVNEEVKRIRINRIHMEEDAGKSSHEGGSEWSNIDCNRAGMPLLEIVTEPDIRSADEAFQFVTLLRKLVRRLNVCDGNMERGNLRCDVNVSVRKRGDEKLGTKVEIKNLNSIRFIRKAIESESSRLIQLLERGETILQQTRGLNETDFSTYPIRTKEDEDDYRYFPEPDLPPFFVTDETIAHIRSTLPPTETEIKNSLQQQYGLTDYDAKQLSLDPELHSFFNRIIQHTNHYKSAANWTLGTVRNYLAANDLTVDELAVPPSSIARLIQLVDEGTLSHGMATQRLWPALLQTSSLNVDEYIRDNDLAIQSSNDALNLLIDAALQKHAQKITEYKKGKKGLLALFVGEVMKLSKGKADAKLVTDMIAEKLKNV